MSVSVFETRGIDAIWLDEAQGSLTSYFVNHETMGGSSSPEDLSSPQRLFQATDISA